jgi:mannose-6-phosphate isomerase-like protein (cupin superfamily)
MGYEQSLEERSFVAKLWGMEEILIHHPDKYTSKLLWITPGVQCSLHCHDHKHETFIALDGLTRVEYYVNGKRFDTILVGWRRDVLDMPPKTLHRFWSLGGDGSVLLEVSTPHSDADVTRLEESRIIGAELD